MGGSPNIFPSPAVIQLEKGEVNGPEISSSFPESTLTWFWLKREYSFKKIIRASRLLKRSKNLLSKGLCQTPLNISQPQASLITSHPQSHHQQNEDNHYTSLDYYIRLLRLSWYNLSVLITDKCFTDTN